MLDKVIYLAGMYIIITVSSDKILVHFGDNQLSLFNMPPLVPQ